MQDVVGPAELEHGLEIAWVVFVSHLQVFERILHIAGLDAAFGHDFGVDGIVRRLWAAAQHLRQVQDGAHAVGQVLVRSGQHAIEERPGSRVVAPRVEQEAELGGGEHVTGRGCGEGAEFLFGFGFAIHAQQQIAEFAAQFSIARIERERAVEFGNERVAIGQQFARLFGGARLAAAGSGQQGGNGVVDAAHGFPHAAQVHQHGAPVRQQAPGLFEMFGGERQFVALLGQVGEFEVRAEVVRAGRQRAFPTLDRGGQRPVDILKRLLRLRVARVANAVEDAARFGFALALIAEEGVLHGHLGVRRIQGHSLMELVARQIVLADLEIGVGEVFADGGALRRELDGADEGGHRRVVVVRLQCGVRAREQIVGRVGRLRRCQRARRH